jgi:probable rRNA maturation factor
MNRVEVNAGEVPLPPWAELSGRFALKVLDYLGRDGWELSILYCGDGFIRDLNARYRNRDEATDILSFSQAEWPESPGPGEGAGIPTPLPMPEGPGTPAGEGGPGETVPAGDLVISLDSLAKNAGYFKVPRDEELRRLLIHGILHLAGMDHRTNEATEPMLRLQETILTNLGGERIIP